MNRQLDEGGLAALLHDMLTRDLGDRHPRDNVPQTEALIEQKLLSQSPEESWWAGLLESGVLPGFLVDEPWTERAIETNKDQLYSDYVAYAKTLTARPHTKAGLAMRLKRRAGIGDRQAFIENRKVWVWVLPQLDAARETWATSTGRAD